jgi:hypothetical protein
MVLELVWVDWGEPPEATKIWHVERQDVGHTVYVHCCCQPCIMDLDPRYTISQNDLPPFLINRFAVRQKSHALLDCSHFDLSLINSQTQTIATERPRHHVPQFRNILMRIVKRGALTGQLSEGRHYKLVLRISAPGYAQQDIGIYDTRSDIHLVVILVNPFAGDGLR